MALAGGERLLECAKSLAGFPLAGMASVGPWRSRHQKFVVREVMAVGLTTEEVFTALAVVDDHVRRRYGNDAWQRVPEWAPRLVHRYNLTGSAGPEPQSTGYPAF